MWKGISSKGERGCLQELCKASYFKHSSLTLWACMVNCLLVFMSVACKSSSYWLGYAYGNGLVMLM